MLLKFQRNSKKNQVLKGKISHGNTWANGTGHTSLSMKQGSLFVLFCTYEIHQIRMLQITFLISLESTQQGGVHQLGFMTFGLAVQKFLNIE
jgi:hypothetical protein